MVAKGSKGNGQKLADKEVRQQLQKTSGVKKEKACPQTPSRKTATVSIHASRKTAVPCSPSASRNSPSPSSGRTAEPDLKRTVKANVRAPRPLSAKHTPSASSSATRPRTNSAAPPRTSTVTGRLRVNDDDSDGEDNSMGVGGLTHEGSASNGKDVEDGHATPSRGKNRASMRGGKTDIRTPAKKKKNRSIVIHSPVPPSACLRTRDNNKGATDRLPRRPSAAKLARHSPSPRGRKNCPFNGNDEKKTTSPSSSSDKCASETSFPRRPTSRALSPPSMTNGSSPTTTTAAKKKTPRAPATPSRGGRKKCADRSPPRPATPTPRARRNRSAGVASRSPSKSLTSPSSKRGFRGVTDENVDNTPKTPARSSKARRTDQMSSPVVKKTRPAQAESHADEGTNAEPRKHMHICTIARAGRDGAYNADGWKVVESMLQKGTPPDSGADIATDGGTALLFAVEQLLKESLSSVTADELYRMIGLLIDAGAEVDHVDNHGNSPRKLLQDAISRYIDWRNRQTQLYQEVPLAHLHFLSTTMLGNPDFFPPYIEQEREEKMTAQKRLPGFLVKRADGDFIEDQDTVVQANEEDGYMVGSGRYSTLKEANAFVRTYWAEQQGATRDYWDEYSVFKNQHGCLKVRTVDQCSVPCVVWVEREDHALKWIQIE
eukprot:GEMP01023014.1.p1 GENE.GEMP01023014.1~~GEMP01023014.1.p1  ORF type:complete len:660 (+),score=183.60 GEMP01023014.1:110-2089(+)